MFHKKQKKMIELLEYFGNDTMVVNCARVSYGKESSNYTEDQNEKLIKYLIKHNHTAPLYHPQLQFRVTCPVYIERQLFKHSVGISINSISGRYVDFSDSYTNITAWRKQSTSSKQGSEGLLDSKSQLKAYQIEQAMIKMAQQAYNELLELGVAKEQARTVCLLNLNTTFIWTGSLYAFIRMCQLRLKPDAQEETRNVVQEMLELLKETQAFSICLSSYNL